MDGLDVPFVLGLRAGFLRDDPYSGDPLPVRDTTGTATETAGTAALLPAGTRHGRHSPVRRYPWDEAYPALRRLMARSPGRDTLTSLQYRNPLTGGPALATLGCLLQGLAAGARTRPRRETASSVIVVARGTGTLICGGQTFPLLPNDVAAIPAWTWHQLTASDRELVLLGLTDRPIHDAFGLFQAEEEGVDGPGIILVWVPFRTQEIPTIQQWPFTEDDAHRIQQPALAVLRTASSASPSSGRPAPRCSPNGRSCCTGCPTPSHSTCPASPISYTCRTPPLWPADSPGFFTRHPIPEPL
jgi:Cupin domain